MYTVGLDVDKFTLYLFNISIISSLLFIIMFIIPLLIKLNFVSINFYNFKNVLEHISKLSFKNIFLQDYLNIIIISILSICLLTYGPNLYNLISKESFL